MLNKLLKSKAVVFDCDGVLLQSNKLKSDAFAETLSGENPKIIREFIDYHQTNGGISRYVKFQYFYTDIKKQFSYADDLKKVLQRYADICKNGLLTCEMVPGVFPLLKRLKSNNVPCYIVSGGDQSEIRKVFKQRQLDQYFSIILGSPKNKKDNLAILKGQGVKLVDSFYFGDAESDMTVSVEEKMKFVFVSGYSEWSRGSEIVKIHNHPSITDFEHL